MKNHHSAHSGHPGSTKNLCDKCGGTYATLAALISHKKSCKGTVNRKRAALDRHLQNERLRASKARQSPPSDHDGNEPDGEASGQHLANSPNAEQHIKMMSEAIAVAAMENSLGQMGNATGQFPVDLFASAPFPAQTPELGTFLESLAPIFAQTNFERGDNSSPTPEEQAALFTQQMMLIHMLQQMHGASPALPPLPLLAAAAAAAAAQQQQQPVSQMQPVSPPPPASGLTDCTENGVESNADNGLDKEDYSDERLLSRYSHPHTSSLSFALSDGKAGENRAIDDKDDEPKRPLSASSSCTNVSASNQPPSTTRKLISSLLDLKDNNPDAPLPPMMSPPKNDSSESAPFNEPNTLELLQKHTEQALQNTMSGGSFLLNGSTDSGDLLNFRKGKDGKEDPSSRHRCRYCGKVFGSDSALQIHIRSHTGERPFKCNVCGNRFTTKGNLKVHFQRHKAKYPHVKMNPHPVPEHLDKFHPPLEPPSNSQSPPPAPPGFFPSSSTTFTNNFHIPAIFSSTLMPFGSEDGAKSDEKSTEEKTKTKPRGFFDFSDFYLNHGDAKGIHPFASSSRSINSDGSDSEGEENMFDEKMNADDSGESDTDFDSTDGAALNLRKRTDTENEEDLDKTFDEDNDDKNADAELAASDHGKRRKSRLEGDSDSKAEMDSNDDLSDDDDLAQYGSPGTLPPSFPLMSLPFGVDLSTIPNSGAVGTASLPGQSLARSENSDSELGEAASKDPIFYQSLLPKPGSTDSTWETLMEVQKASETVKLQQLVDNIEHKLKDPNQCFFCKRVLSCKSALQMHYRTHTGERPFKCKICGRAFTTKGNLKTHMGVHRVKPPLRMMHQCPICHKQFTNALVLQQHIRTHTGEAGVGPTGDLSPEMLAELKNNPLLPSSFPRAFLPPNFGAPFPIPPLGPSLFPPSLIPEMAAQQFARRSPFAQFHFSLHREASNDSEKDKKENNKNVVIEDEPDCQASDLSTSKSRKRKVVEKEVIEKEIIEKELVDKEVIEREMHDTSEIDMRSMSDITDNDDDLGSSPLKLTKADEEEQPIALNNDKAKLPKEESHQSMSTLSALENHVMKSISQVSPQSKALFVSTSSPDKGNALDLTPKGSQDSNSQSSPASTDSRAFPPSPYAGLQFHPTGRPNTTCRICCKTFACYSALEIHIRSHTKERPFKCEVCDRGFSTKGNMKQHMLTHKIRDLPPDLYTAVSPPANTTLGNFLTSNNISKILRKPSNTNSSNNSNSSSRVSSPQTPNGHNSNSLDSTDKVVVVCNNESQAGDQSSTSSRASGSNKHMCNICIKPFSSGSALQIHMRTHTGDKPFKCTICGRAFTTKGNLKVHMGTHMWNNNPSRRGRRMSIDLPNLHISPTGGPRAPTPAPSQPDLASSPVNTNADIFFPYLPSHLPNFLNGPPEASQLAMQQMMLMKMMSANQSSQLAPLSVASDKRTLSSNGEEEEMDNNSTNGDADEDQPKQVLCEPEIELSESGSKSVGNFFRINSHARDEPFDEEDKSRHSEQSNHGSDWSARDWKMSFKLYEGTDISPDELQQHIKAQLQAAINASAGDEKCAGSVPDSPKTVATAVHANGSMASP